MATEIKHPEHMGIIGLTIIKTYYLNCIRFVHGLPIVGGIFVVSGDFILAEDGHEAEQTPFMGRDS